MVHSKYIIILGPDGSGKTTLSDKLAEKIKAEKRSVKRINFSFGIMPPISSVLRRKKHKYLPEGETNSGIGCSTTISYIGTFGHMVWN